MNSIDIYLKVKKHDIAFLCSFLESFEGMLAFRTPNPDRYSDTSIVHLMISPDYQEQFNSIMKGLKKEIKIEETEK
ncbi:DUF4911 domain-containing protein [Candidatus Margulisiibacteriota bacterium]